MNRKPTADEIAADLYCSQVQTNANIGDSAFNHEIHNNLYGDDYADAMMQELGLIGWYV